MQAYSVVPISTLKNPQNYRKGSTDLTSVISYRRLFTWFSVDKDKLKWIKREVNYNNNRQK